jgi:PAS domain S-box-containing protein
MDHENKSDVRQENSSATPFFQGHTVLNPSGTDMTDGLPLLTNLPAVVFRCTDFPSLSCLYVSDEIERLTGYCPGEFSLGNGSFSRIIHPEDQGHFFEAVKTATEKNQQFRLEFRIIGKNGNTHWVHGGAKHFNGSSDGSGWFDGFLFDVTERMQDIEGIRKAKILAEEANQAKSEFLANISHEIRTPLNSVLGFAELLEGMTNDPIQVKYLNSIKASGKNLMMLINDLLDLSKIEAGRMTLHYTLFDIHRLTDEIRNVFSLRVAIKGIGYTEEINDNFPAVIRFDETRLRQILINLVGNAVKFTHHGEVKICINFQLLHSNKKTMVMEIKVIDTGIGIPEDSYRVIFESFRQHSQLDSRKYGGTGLGLAITKRLVEAMEGTINVESHVGKGSTFTVVFPVVEFAESQDDKTAADFLLLGQNGHLFAKRDKKRSETEVKPGEVSPAGLNANDYFHLVNHFNRDLKERWKSYESKQPLKEIKQFAHEIIEIGKKYQLAYIFEYGDQLLTTLENFDIEEMRIKLDYFPDLLKQLNKQSHEIG